MNIVSDKINKVMTTIAFTVFMLSVNAQNLPAKQDHSLLIPSDVKIDGKASEWNNQFQAFNPTTEIFYTIANNNENLYFIIKAIKPLIVKKIISQGLTISVNNAAKKDIGSAVSITYPLLYNKNGTILMRLNEKNINSINDSVLHVMNAQLNDNAKDIRLLGFKDAPDSISVYNEYGVKVSSNFDNNKIYTCEFVLPIKLLRLTSNKTISYNIKLNGITVNGKQVRMSNDGKAIIIGDPSKGPISEMVYPADVMASYFPTDFWAEYTLATKP